MSELLSGAERTLSEVRDRFEGAGDFGASPEAGGVRRRPWSLAIFLKGGG